MELKDLKNGNVVETKNGTLLLVVKFGFKDSSLTTDIAMSEECWINLGHYNKDLTRMASFKEIGDKGLEDKREIVAVYEPKRYGVYCTLKEILDKNNLKKIWEYQ